MTKLNLPFGILILLIWFSSCKPGKTPETSPPSASDSSETTAVVPSDASTAPVEESEPAMLPPVNDSWKKLAEASGDLDQDGTAEKVVLYTTGEETDFGLARIIQVYKKSASGWEQWQEIQGGVLPTEAGGMMGDPFEGLAVEHGAIVINHFGGSREKWSYTHRFRYQQSDWALIGATIIYGVPCEEWIEYDYNLSTGKLLYKREQDICDAEGEEQDTKILEQKEYAKPQPSLPRMAGFEPGNNELRLGAGKSFYY